VPCFYALGEPKTPLRISLIGIAVNLALNLTGFVLLRLGHAGLALTTSAVALINIAQLSVALSRRIDLGTGRDWALFLARCLLAALACGVAAWRMEHLIAGLAPSRWLSAAGLFLAVAAGVLTYFAVARVLRLEESGQALAMIRRRLPGGRLLGAAKTEKGEA